MKNKIVTLGIGTLALVSTAQANIVLKSAYEALDAKSQKFIASKACGYATQIANTNESRDYASNKQKGISMSYDIADANRELLANAPILSYPVRMVLNSARADAQKGDLTSTMDLVNTVFDTANCR